MKPFHLFLSFIVIFLGISFGCVDAEAAPKKFSKNWTQNGVSSYYAKRFNGRLTASGERYRHYEMTAAHRTLPFGTKVQVTDKESGKSIVVKINDRGPYHGNRILDLSGAAASKLGITKQGLCDIELKVISLPNKPYRYGKPKYTTLLDDVNNELQVVNNDKPKLNMKPADNIAKLIAANFDTNKL